MGRFPNIDNRQSGFTMIELLISLTIIGFIMALMSSGISLVSRSWDINSERLERMEAASRTAQLFRRDIESIRRRGEVRNKKLEYLFSGDANQLTFVSIEPPYPTAPGPYFIKYGPSEDSPGGGLQRSRAEFKDDQKEFPGATPTNRVDMLDAGFEFRFFYGSSENNNIVWSDSWTDTSKLPKLIRLQLTDKNKNNPIEIAQIIAPVRINAEQACISANTRACSLKRKNNKKKSQPQTSNGSQGIQSSPFPGFRPSP